VGTHTHKLQTLWTKAIQKTSHAQTFGWCTLGLKITGLKKPESPSKKSIVDY